MKRTKKVKEILKPDFREKFSEYQKKVDELLDEYNVPQELINKLAILDIDIEEQIDADMVELTDKAIVGILKEDEDLRDSVLYYMDEFCSSDNTQRIIDYLEANEPKWQYIEIGSIIEQMKFDEFKEQLAENPYQLKIA